MVLLLVYVDLMQRVNRRSTNYCIGVGGVFCKKILNHIEYFFFIMKKLGLCYFIDDDYFHYCV